MLLYSALHARSEEWAYVQISIASFLFKIWNPFLCTLHTDVKLKPSCESVATTKFSEIFSGRQPCQRVNVWWWWWW